MRNFKFNFDASQLTKKHNIKLSKTSPCTKFSFILSARPQRSAVTDVTSLCPHLAQRAKSGYASLRSSAFTMAEAIIVMTILGIIASLVITNLRPDNYRDGALETLTKKSIEQIDEATKHILHYNSFNGTMNELYLPGENEKFSFSQDFSKTFQLYKKYLTTTRKEYNQSLEKLNEIISSSSNANT